ncbi:MAG: slipin family protein [Spirochaetaceae bacterium]|jgi:regulator of protease activity HflC (stomatin/prohibitin superfamily)|nr:slipin family protein [Spirochaetaceae bacterium]
MNKRRKGPAGRGGKPPVKVLPGPRLKTDCTALKVLFLLLAVSGLAAGIAGFPGGRLPGMGRPGSGLPASGLLLAASALLALAVLAVSSVKKTEEWQRAVVLRLGRFRRIAGPGLFFLVPVLDRVSQVIDIRIRVTDFTAQETLTGDSVTVNVDAFAFWLVWDPQKAALEVEDYEDAVVLASKAAMRKAVSRNDLSTFLARGDLIEKQIQEEVDRQTTEWGITVQYIEITDVQIPAALQDTLSRLAQAEREKKSRILLAEAEIEIARKLEETARIYAKNEPAMKLKILSILNEGLKAGNSMMLVPNSITENLEADDIYGLEALAELRRKERSGE